MKARLLHMPSNFRPGLTVMEHGKFRFVRWRWRLLDCSYGTSKSRKKQIGAASACFLQPFTWQTRIGCYGNCLIDVKENPNILKRFWQLRLQVIRDSCKLRDSYRNCLAILWFSDYFTMRFEGLIVRRWVDCPNCKSHGQTLRVGRSAI